MIQINQLLKKYELKPYRYETRGKNTVVDTKMGRFIVKKNKINNDILTYLNSRNFDYYPNFINNVKDEFIIEEYIEDEKIPKEQKIIDLINVVSLLHNKTTHYKETTKEDYKNLYDDILNNIEYLKDYYLSLITNIETHVFMSPFEYLLSRNISKINSALNFCENELEVWYKLISEKTVERQVVLHNNLDLSHFIKKDKSFLINWNRAKIGNPIFDIYILYKRHALDFDFQEVLKTYINNYPLKEEELKLLFILISLPDKIEEDKEYIKTKKLYNMIDILYKTDRLISPYYSKQSIQD